jgi:hypothetical protein
MATCKSCDAEILWAETRSGKSMPLDAAPTAAGNMVLVNGKTWTATDDDRRLHRELRTSHFATCVNAPLHRKLR